MTVLLVLAVVACLGFALRHGGDQRPCHHTGRPR